MFVFASGMLAILLGIFPGWFVFPAGPFSVTMLSGTLFVKLVLQQYFGDRNNMRMKELTRGTLLSALFPNSPEAQVFWKGQYRKRYPEWRKTLRKQQRLWSHKAWNAVVNHAVLIAANGRPLLKVGVEIPIHGLSLAEVKRTVNSIRNQSYRVAHIVLAVNGHTGKPIERKIRRWVASLRDERVQVIYREEGHKRSAMAAAFRVLYELGCDEIINVDGDTILDPDCVALGLIVKYLDPRAQAITSNVEIINHRRDSLSYQTWLRYLYANHVERAAESWFHCVACMSGPYMQCRTVDIMELLQFPHEWEEQYFGWGARRERVGPGDDRTLTQRFLSRLHGTVFVPDIHTLTECPETIAIWKRQQLRWSRSGLRGFWIEWNQRWFWQNFAVLTIFDEFYLAWFSLFVTMVVGLVTVHTVALAIGVGLSGVLGYLWPYLVAVVGVNLIRVVGFAVTQRDWRMLGLLGYQYYLIRYLVVIKYKAMGSLANSNWGTRSAPTTT